MKELAKGLTEKRTPDGICALTLHYTADPDRARPEWKETERRKYTSESKWQSEQEIVFGAGGGERLFAEILNRYGHKILIDQEESGFRPAPGWEYFGGFDYGKASPTAALVGCTDYDGTIYILREYYVPGLSPKQHVPYLQQLQGFQSVDAQGRPIPIYSDPSIFYNTSPQVDGTFKAIAWLYADDGIENLVSAPEKHELLGMERILSHWMNLDQQEPTLKIVCPKEKQNLGSPQFGVHNEGCPNLLWELRRTRRQELTPIQLATKNPTEKIVDKQNHLRDCLKYMILALPEPAEKGWQLKVTEAVAPLAAAHDLTSANVRYLQMKAEAEGNSRPIRLGRCVRRG
jgi:hypothetical protein